MWKYSQEPDLEGGEHWTEAFRASRIKVDCSSKSSKDSGLAGSRSSCSNCCRGERDGVKWASSRVDHGINISTISSMNTNKHSSIHSSKSTDSGSRIPMWVGGMTVYWKGKVVGKC